MRNRPGAFPTGALFPDSPTFDQQTAEPFGGREKKNNPPNMQALESFRKSVAYQTIAGDTRQLL